MFKKFLKNKRGNLAITSAIALVPIIAAVSAAVDYSMISRHTSDLQQALDAAALATGKKLGVLETNTELEAYSSKFFYSNIGGLNPSDVTFTFDPANSIDGNTITLRANYNYPLLFGRVLNKTSFTVGVETTVKAGNDTLEIALVLDNSGSMRNSRIATQKTAATALVNQIHTAMAGSNLPNPVKFSLVPFAGHVNVGSNNANQSWVDSTGLAPNHAENLDWSEYPGAVQQPDGRWQDASGNWLTRFTLFDDMVGVSWKGCVEARPYPYQVNDQNPDVDTPETLFVPVFAPDEPDDYTDQREQISTVVNVPGETTGGLFCKKRKKNKNKCNKWNDGYKGNVHSSGVQPILNLSYYKSNKKTRKTYNDGSPYGGWELEPTTSAGGTETVITDGDWIVEEGYYNNYLDDWANAPTGKLQFDPAHTGTGADQNKRQAWTFKYQGQSSNTNDTWKGPNSGCTTNAITPLTTSKLTVTTAINNMAADGSTNIPLGIIWGWRSLTAGAPFSEGRSASTPDNSKIMVVMTDGNNTYYTPDSLGAESQYNKSYYGSYGYTRSTTFSPKGRLFDAYDAEANPTHDRSTFQAAMDEHMLEICTNAKNDGINIYTVAFNVSDGSSVKTMLETCSSTNAKTGLKQYFDASGQAALLAAFESIGNDISNLRLAK